MTLEELTYSVAIEWGKESEFAVIERIKLHIIAARSTIIQRRYDQTKLFPQSLIMTLNYKNIIEVSPFECGCPSNCKVFRTKDKLPKPIIVRDDSYFAFVGSSNSFSSFSYVSPEAVQDISYRRYTQNLIYYTYMNEYLYFFTPVQEITIRYIPENPLKVLELGHCKCAVINENGELELEDSLVEGIVGLLRPRQNVIINPQLNEVTIDGNS